jgi:glycosyltransferase involved in cell wall biosynthesis
VIFLGLCSEEKGLFAAARAVVDANQASRTSDDAPVFVLTAAGPFDSESSAARWRDTAEKHPAVLRHIGVVNDIAKKALFANAHALCLPTRYPAEALPLVAIEALACDRPVIATRWRGLPEIVTAEVGILVPPGNEPALAGALLEIQRHRPSPGVCRARFLAHYTYDQHLKKLRDALHAALTSPSSRDA